MTKLESTAQTTTQSNSEPNNELLINSNSETERLLQTISNFFDKGSALSFQEANNVILQRCLSDAIRCGYNENHILDMVFMITAQSLFIAELQENFQKLNQITNPKNLN